MLSIDYQSKLIGGRQLNRRRSNSEYLTIILSLRGANLNSQSGILGQSQTQQGGGAAPRYVEKNGNLLSSEVGLIFWVRSLPRHTTMEIQGGWDEHTQIIQHWVSWKPENSE